MTLQTFFRNAEKGIHKTSELFSWLGVVVLILMMLFISVDVIARYIFMHPITGSIDYVVVMMVLLVFPCLAYATSLNRHVRTDILFNALGPRGQGGLDIVNALCSIFIVGLIAWQLSARAWSIIRYPPGITTDYFQWPHLPFIILAAVGCSLMCLELVVWLVRSVYRFRRG